MSNMADGLGFKPRAKEPESSLSPGMASPRALEARGGVPGVGPLSMPDTSSPGSVAAPSPATWVYDFDPGTGSSRATYNGQVSFTSGGSGTAGVTTFNTRSGAVVLTTADITGAGGATANNTVLTGNPTAPTPPPGDADQSIATTAFVAQAIVANPIVQSFNGRTGAVALTLGDVTNSGGAPAASPALSGTPTTPTAAQGNASSQIASTQFVANAIAGGTVVSWNGRQGAVTLTLSDVMSVGGAPISSPTFTGTPLVPTAAPGTATTQAASTAFVTNAITASTGGVASFNTRTGAVVLNTTDIVNAGGLPSVSGNMTGTPTCPTATAGTNTTQVASTAFVAAAITAQSAGVTTFNGRNGAVTLTTADVTTAGGAPTASPTLTGTPKSVTPAPGDNSTNIATTAFVAAGYAPLSPIAAGYAPTASPTFTGTVTIPAGASIAGYATTASVPAASSTTPLMNGIAAIGTGTTFARPDHVHPTDTSLVPKAGGTMTGNLLMPAFAAPAGTTVGALNGSPSINYTTSLGLIVECSANRPLSLNLIGANGIIQQFFQSGTACGSITVANATSTAYNTSSDGRLKTDLREFNAGTILDALQAWNFKWKANGHRAHGLVAQQVNQIYPEAVTQDEEHGWGLDYSKFVPLLIAEIKMLRARVAVLENREKR